MQHCVAIVPGDGGGFKIERSIGVVSNIGSTSSSMKPRQSGSIP